MITIYFVIGEKGPYHTFSEFSFCNLESIAATAFNFGVKVLNHPATLARNLVPHPLPVWAGQAHKSIVFKIRRLCLTLAIHCSVQEAYSSF